MRENREDVMRKPVVGVIGNAYRIENRFAVQMVGERNLRAVAEVAGALPLMFAGEPEITDLGALLDTVDGIVLTGARANVHPTRFNTEPDPKHEPYDIHRARRAAVRHLPWLAGNECRLRWFTAP
jgi:putative glutamine amidotransferase